MDSKKLKEAYERLKENRERDARKRQILLELEKGGVPMEEVVQNGYWFLFPYRGMRIIFMNQPNRLYGKMHRLPQSEAEIYMMENEAPFILSLSNKKEARRFRRKFRYMEFQFYDMPAGRAARKVLACARKKTM